RLAITLGYLAIQRPQVIQYAKAQQAAGKQPDYPGHPFAHIEAMNAEDAEEGQQDPGDVVIGRAGDITAVSIAVHSRDQEQVDDPADKEQAEGEEPDGAGDLATVIETVCAHEAENPEDIADGLA